MRVVVAALVGAAGVIHLAMVPAHSADSALDAALFALTGWAQLALAAGTLASARRPVLQAVVLVNLLVIAAWATSRTVGLPWGAHAGVAETISSIDLLASALAGAGVVAAGAALARPGLGVRWTREAVVMASMAPVGLLVATSLALASTDAREHGHADGADHAHGETASLVSARDRCDLAVNPAAYWRETEVVGLDTMTGGAGGATADHHASATASHPDPFEGRGSPELDELIRATANAGEGEIGAAMVVTKLSEAPDDAYEAWLHRLPSLVGSHGHGGATGDDTGGHGGHMGPTPWTGMTDAAQCEQLGAELGRSREVAMRYPTAQDALDAGWVMVTPYVPGIAAHYMRFDYVDEVFDIDEPEMLLYDGNTPAATMVGLSYYIIHEAEAEPGLHRAQRPLPPPHRAVHEGRARDRRLDDHRRGVRRAGRPQGVEPRRLDEPRVGGARVREPVGHVLRRQPVARPGARRGL